MKGWRRWCGGGGGRRREEEEEILTPIN